MKKLLGVYKAPPRHWVGDGFPVRSLFTYDSHGQHISPFLLLDHAGPKYFEPASQPRGVGEHPHRGIETVTIVYKGEVDHLDSTGSGGRIGPGDVQWMTSGGGIMHQEFHSRDFTQKGGELEMVQLWVNLPAKDKMTTPGYQTILNADIPTPDLPDGAGYVRVIAGDYNGEAAGPASTFSPMNVWDVRLNGGHEARLDQPKGWSGLVVALHGDVQVNGTEAVREGEFALLDRSGSGLSLAADSDATVLVLSGQPLDEPIAGYGPFVMNTEAEIQQALHDLRTGKFSRIAAPA